MLGNVVDFFGFEDDVSDLDNFLNDDSDFIFVVTAISSSSDESKTDLDSLLGNDDFFLLVSIFFAVSMEESESEESRIFGLDDIFDFFLAGALDASDSEDWSLFLAFSKDDECSLCDV